MTMLLNIGRLPVSVFRFHILPFYEVNISKALPLRLVSHTWYTTFQESFASYPLMDIGHIVGTMTAATLPRALQLRTTLFNHFSPVTLLMTAGEHGYPWCPILVSQPNTIISGMGMYNTTVFGGIEVSDARGVVLRRLALVEATSSGLQVMGPRTVVSISDCRVASNGLDGIAAFSHAIVNVKNTWIVENFRFGIRAEDSALVFACSVVNKDNGSGNTTVMLGTQNCNVGVIEYDVVKITSHFLPFVGH